jgi:hypothetical protein
LSFGAKSEKYQDICRYEFEHAKFNAAQRLWLGEELVFEIGQPEPKLNL